jgi:cytidylate kinase
MEPRKPKHITITGDLGSGKSMIASKLVDRYGAQRYSTGAIQRDLAAKLGITTLELNHRADTDPSIDVMIDSAFTALDASPTMVVVDSRMAWHFMPHSFKLCLKVDPKIAAQRIWDHQRPGEGYANLAECLHAIEARKASERARFFRTYGVQLDDASNYDLVVDTSHRSPEETEALVFEAYEKSR